MNTYARIENGAVREIILPLLNDDGVEWPVAERFTPEFVTQLVDATSFSPMPIEGWSYDGATFAPPAAAVPSAEQILAANTAEQAVLMAAANSATLGQADAYIAGLLDAADAATFKAWAAYKLALSKVDLTSANPTWPATPTA